jgi:cytochrome P450
VSRSLDESADAGLVEFSRPSARHSAFGMGPHRCLGSHLARLELAVALETWHRDITDYAIATDMTLGMWGGTNMAIKALPLRLGRAG